MSTYTQIMYQIVFSTKNRNPVLIKSNRNELFKYIRGILETKNCLLYQISGVEDHVHILTHIHPSISLSSLIKDIKIASSQFIHDKNLFPAFKGWQDGYGAFTYSINSKEDLILYIANQEEHHKKTTFREEYIALMKEHNIVFDGKYLF